MEEINFEDFLRVQIRTGTILEATLNTKARNPAYILRIDFGPLGIKTSSAQITENYQPDELVGLQISAVLNFPAKRVAGFKSEVLVLGAYSEEKGAEFIKNNWSFEGVFGTFDRASLQRGYQVYQEVCSGCHSVSGNFLVTSARSIC